MCLQRGLLRNSGKLRNSWSHGEGQDKVYGMFWNTQQDITGMFTCLVSQTNGGGYHVFKRDGNFLCGPRRA